MKSIRSSSGNREEQVDLGRGFEGQNAHGTIVNAQIAAALQTNSHAIHVRRSIANLTTQPRHPGSQLEPARKIIPMDETRNFGFDC